MEKWKCHVKEIVSEYPRYKKEIKEIEQSAIYKSSSPDGQPRGSGTSDKTAMCALQLAGDERLQHLRRAVEAVECAIYITERENKGKDKMSVIKMVYWDKSHLLYGAALEVLISEAQAKRWNGDFIKIIGKKLGFI